MTHKPIHPPPTYYAVKPRPGLNDRLSDRHSVFYFPGPVDFSMVPTYKDGKRDGTVEVAWVGKSYNGYRVVFGDNHLGTNEFEFSVLTGGAVKQRDGSVIQRDETIKSRAQIISEFRTDVLEAAKLEPKIAEFIEAHRSAFDA